MPKKLNLAEFAALAVTTETARHLPAAALTAFLNSGFLWRGILAELEIYALHEAAALGAIRPDAATAAMLPPETVAALTADKRKELRGRFRAEIQSRGRATAALLKLLQTQVAACDNAGPAFRKAADEQLTAYLNPAVVEAA